MKKAFLIFLFLSLVVVLTPLEQQVAPDWTVRVVDRAGTPITTGTVLEIWQQFSIEAASHQEKLSLADHGVVHFPRRVKWSPLLWRFLGCANQYRRFGYHAGCGAQGYVYPLVLSYRMVDETLPARGADLSAPRLTVMTMQSCVETPSVPGCEKP